MLVWEEMVHDCKFPNWKNKMIWGIAVRLCYTQCISCFIYSCMKSWTCGGTSLCHFFQLILWKRNSLHDGNIDKFCKFIYCCYTAGITLICGHFIQACSLSCCLQQSFSSVVGRRAVTTETSPVSLKTVHCLSWSQLALKLKGCDKRIIQICNMI